MSMRKVGPLLIVVAAVLWGIDGVLRRSLYSLPPISIVFYEHLIGFILIAPFFLRKIFSEKFTRKEWIAIVVVSLFSGLLGTLWFTTALQKVNFIPFSVVFLLQKLQPIFAVFAAWALLGERITKRYVWWALLAILAAYFVTFPNGVVNFATGNGTFMAALLAVGAAAAWASSTAFSRLALKEHSNTIVTGLRFAITIPMAFIGVVLLAPDTLGALPSSSQLVRLLIIALSTGMVALLIYYKGLKYTEVKVATLLELMFPLTAVLIDFFFYDSVLAWSQYVAAAVLLFAAYNVSRAAHREDRIESRTDQDEMRKNE